MDVSNRNRLGTWLSPLPQPILAESSGAPLAGAPTVVTTAPVPRDSVHRRYLRMLARTQNSFVKENQRYYCEPPSEAFRAYPLFATAVAPNNSTSNCADPEALNRSQRNAPITCPFTIRPEAARARLERSKLGRAVAGALSYGWAEELSLNQESSKLMYIQVRQHTKLESYHDIRRPVYCINAQSCDQRALDLRLVAIIFTELATLMAAAQEFARPEDFEGGNPVFDQHGRVWIDDRLIRRAAYHYSQHQILRQHDQLYKDEEAIADRLKRAHLLVLRSHLPEFPASPELRCALGDGARS